MKRLIVGLSGASGVIFGVRLLEVLEGIPQLETHLVISKGAELTLRLETEKSLANSSSFPRRRPGIAGI